MSARLGMAAMIARLRQMTEAGEKDYELAGVTYWSEDDLQDILDEHRSRQEALTLRALPELTAGSIPVYTRYELPRLEGLGAAEGPESGSTAFRVYDSTGTDIAAADYTFNLRDLSITFDADQEGYARYWSGYIYDIRAAAVDVWLRKAAHVWNAINFSADGANFSREALYVHCQEMAKLFGARQGVKVARMVRSDLG